MTFQKAIIARCEADARPSILLVISEGERAELFAMLCGLANCESVTPETALHLASKSVSQQTFAGAVIAGRDTDPRIQSLAAKLGERSIPFTMVFDQLPQSADFFLRYPPSGCVLATAPDSEIATVLSRFTGSLENVGCKTPPFTMAGALTVQNRHIKRRIAYEDIVALSASGDYVEIHQQHTAFVVRGTLSAFEHCLDPRQFTRIHRAHIVPIQRVVQVETVRPKVRNVRLDAGLILPIGRTYWKAVKPILKHTLGLQPEAGPGLYGTI